MRNYCDRVQNDTGDKHHLLNKYQNKLRKAAEWYKKQFVKYNKLLQSEMLQALSADILDSKEEVDLIIDDYDDNFGAKLSLFCVSDFLCKHILSTFSYGPENSATRQFSFKECSQSWFENKDDAIVITELLQDILEENNEGRKINLSVLLEERQIRSKLTHAGDVAICLSAIRCYNIIRDMLIFMDSEYESQLSRFTYPNVISCDMQAFFSHTNNMTFNQRTTILVAGALHDIPSDQRAILANMPWDIVIDFDAYTDFGGLRSVVTHSQFHPQLLTKETTKSMILKKGITEWFKCGQLVTPSHDEKYSKTLKILPTKKAFYSGRFNRYYSEVSDIFKEILQKVAQKLNPVTIIFLHSDNKIAHALLDMCEKELDTVTYAFSGIYYWGKETIADLEHLVYAPYAQYNVDYRDSFQFISSDLDSFFRGLKDYEYNFNKREDVSADSYLPSNEGPKELSLNQVQNTETYFEVLYHGCGQEDLKKASELLDIFYRGGSAPWCAFDNKEAADLVSQDDFARMIHKVKTQLGRIPDANKDKIFYLEHTPGIGGSTLLRRIGWELHNDYPVLLIHNYDKSRVSKVIIDLYDYLLRGVAILVDENFDNLEELEADIKELPRACVLIASVRQNNGGHNNAQRLHFSTITPESERQLKKIFKKNSPLTDHELEQKELGYDSFIRQDISTMRCPFMIGLYYMDKHFDGINGYADQVISHITFGVKEIKAIAFMALCDIYGQESLPAVFINKYLGLNPRSNYIDTNEYIKSAFYIPSNQDTAVYRPKHYLISQSLLNKCSQYLYGVVYHERLSDIALELIEAIFAECKDKFADAYQIILEKIFIKNRIGSESNQSAFSKLIEEVSLPEKRKEILLKLASLSAQLADKADPEEFSLIYMMTAHFYGHLSRLCSKHGAGIDNFVLASQYIEESKKYMELCNGQDSRVYHMYGESKRAALNDRWNQLLKMEDPIPEAEYSNFEDEISKIMNTYALSAQAGSPEYAFTSQMGLLIDYLYFVYRKKKINTAEQLTILSASQQKYRTDIEELISVLDDIELNEDTQSIYTNQVNQYRSNIMMNDYGKAIEYYKNRLDYLLANHGTVSEITSARQGLVNARLGKYRVILSDGRSFYSNIPLNEVEEILDMLDITIEQSFDINRYQARQQRISVYNRWMQLAKYSSGSVDKGIEIALKWKDLEQKDKTIDPRPYYYLYVLYYLSVLEGNKANIPLAKEYQKLSYQKAASAGYKLDYIRDFFVRGTGMGQLQDSNCVNDWSNVIECGAVDFRAITGYFRKVVSKKGIVEIQDPINWLGREAKFRSEEKNNLGENQATHKVKFYGGFGYEQILALDMTVKDMDTGEELPLIVKKKGSIVNVQTNRSDIKEFVPSFVVKNPNTGVCYLNGKIDNRYAGLSALDIEQFGPQVDAYGNTEAVLNLLCNLSKFKVKCMKHNGKRHPVSLFGAGKALQEVLGMTGNFPEEDKRKKDGASMLVESTSTESNTGCKRISSEVKNTIPTRDEAIRGMNIKRLEEKEKPSQKKDILPDYAGEVLIKISEFTGKGVKGSFEKDGKEWFAIIPTGISNKEGKQLVGKSIKAKIISKGNNAFILRK